MSRLDSFIRRMQAQRDCLDMLAGLIGAVPGPVIELGLGDGRTYDHLRGIFPDRAIFAFDRRNAAHPDSAPDADHMILGDFARMLPAALHRIGRPAALIHCDFGSSDRSFDAQVATAIGPLLVPLLGGGERSIAARGRLDAAGSAADSRARALLPMAVGVEGMYFNLASLQPGP